MQTIVLISLLIGIGIGIVNSQKVQQVVCVKDEKDCKTKDYDCARWRTPTPGQYQINDTIYCLTKAELQICGIKKSVCQLSKRTEDKMTPYQRWCKKKNAGKLTSVATRSGFEIPLRRSDPFLLYLFRSTGQELSSVHFTNHIPPNAVFRRPFTGQPWIPCGVHTHVFYHIRNFETKFSLVMIDSLNCLYVKQFATAADYDNPASSFVIVEEKMQGNTDWFSLRPMVNPNLLLTTNGSFVTGPTTPDATANAFPEFNIYGFAALNYTTDPINLDNLFTFEVLLASGKTNCFHLRLGTGVLTDYCSVPCFTTTVGYGTRLSRRTEFIPTIGYMTADITNSTFDLNVTDLFTSSTRMRNVGAETVIHNPSGATITQTFTASQKFTKKVSVESEWSSQAGVETSISDGSLLGILSETPVDMEDDVGEKTAGIVLEETFTISSSINVPPRSRVEAQAMFSFVDVTGQEFGARMRITATMDQIRLDNTIAKVRASGKDILNYLAKTRGGLQTNILKIEPFGVIIKSKGTLKARFGMKMEAKIKCIREGGGDCSIPDKSANLFDY